MKCSGLLLRSSFPILAARARHLFSVAPMPALSVASRPSSSSDIMRFRDQLTWLAAIVATNISRLFIFSRCVQAFATPTATLRSVSGRTETGVEAYHEDTHVLPHAERKRRGKQ